MTLTMGRWRALTKIVVWETGGKMRGKKETKKCVSKKLNKKKATKDDKGLRLSVNDWRRRKSLNPIYARKNKEKQKQKARSVNQNKRERLQYSKDNKLNHNEIEREEREENILRNEGWKKIDKNETGNAKKSTVERYCQMEFKKDENNKQKSKKKKERKKQN